MTASIDTVSEPVRGVLRDLDSADQLLFLEERNKCIAQSFVDGPVLDQLCCLRVVMARLSQGYAVALARFEERLEARARMKGGWRDSVTRKLPHEYESPMPWLHPFKLARDELMLLEQQMEASLAQGGADERGFAMLFEILEKHGLGLPLPSPTMQPKFRPGAGKGAGKSTD